MNNVELHQYILEGVNKMTVKFLRNPIKLHEYMGHIKECSNEELFKIINGYNDYIGYITTREDIINDYIILSDDKDNIIRNNLLKQMIWNNDTIELRRHNYKQFGHLYLCQCHECGESIFIEEPHSMNYNIGYFVHNICKKPDEIDELTNLMNKINIYEI